MATVYSPPADLGDPPDFTTFRDANGRYDFEAHIKAEEAWITTVQDAARSAHQGDIVGEVVRFPVGDGFAQYVVWSTRPCVLIHLPVGDNWSIPEAHERGLRVADLRQRVASQNRINALFSRSSP